MKKLLLFLLCIIPTVGYANDDVIDLHVSKNTIELGDVFDMQLSVTFDSRTEIPSITIPWIENFNIFSTSQWETVRQVNDDFERTWKLSLKLEPKSSWDFTLWPVVISIDGQQYTSSEERVIVSGIKTILADESKEAEKDSIEGIKKPPFQIPYFMMFLGVLLGLFYFFMYRYFASRKKKIKKQQIVQPAQEISHKALLKKLKKSIPDIDDAVFFSELHRIIRDYVRIHFSFPTAQKSTLKEITPYIKNTELLRVFMDSYTREFDGKKTTTPKKESIVEAYIQIL